MPYVLQVSYLLPALRFLMPYWHLSRKFLSCFKRPAYLKCSFALRDFVPFVKCHFITCTPVLHILLALRCLHVLYSFVSYMPSHITCHIFKMCLTCSTWPWICGLTHIEQDCRISFYNFSYVWFPSCEVIICF